MQYLQIDRTFLPALIPTLVSMNSVNIGQNIMFNYIGVPDDHCYEIMLHNGAYDNVQVLSHEYITDLFGKQS